MTSGIAHFQISGEWLTEHVRERILSDMEDSALALLVENLDGLTHEQAVGILRGRQRFTGVNTLELADEDPAVGAAWEAKLRERYGNRVKLRQAGGSGLYGWFRPCAYVTSFGPEDVPKDGGPVPRRTPADRPRNIRWGHRRLWHYALDGEVAISPFDQDAWPGLDRMAGGGGLSESVRDGLGFIFEAVNAVPGWLHDLCAKTPTEAMLAHVRAGWPLEERGHTVWYPGEIQRYGASLRATLIAAEDKTARDPRNSPAMRAEAAQAAENLRAAERARKLVEDRRRDQEEAEAEARMAREQADRAALIREKAGPIDGPGWFDLTIMPGAPAEVTVRVPRIPFVCWSLWRTPGRNRMPAYSPVSPPGLRLYGDDPYHSDWMIGAFPDRPVWHTYRDEEVRRASYRAQGEVQAEYLNFQAHILTGRGSVSGVTYHPKSMDQIDSPPRGSILILPDARPGWDRLLREASGAIVPVGGELCHLAVVSLESGRILARDPDCLRNYPPGVFVRIDADAGRIHVETC